MPTPLTPLPLERVLQQLHDSEINAGVQTFYDAGMRVWIGDERRFTAPSLVIGRFGRQPIAWQRGCMRPRCVSSLRAPIPKSTAPKRWRPSDVTTQRAWVPRGRSTYVSASGKWSRWAALPWGNTIRWLA